MHRLSVRFVLLRGLEWEKACLLADLTKSSFSGNLEPGFICSLTTKGLEGDQMPVARVSPQQFRTDHVGVEELIARRLILKKSIKEKRSRLAAGRKGSEGWQFIPGGSLETRRRVEEARIAALGVCQNLKRELQAEEEELRCLNERIFYLSLPFGAVRAIEQSLEESERRKQVSQPMVLVVDDSEVVQRGVELILEGRAICLKATTLKEATQQFVLHLDEITAILMDGSVPPGGAEPGFTAWKWVNRIRRVGFTGDIVAFSSNQSSQEKLVEAGCNKQFAKGGEELKQFLDLLGLPLLA